MDDSILKAKEIHKLKKYDDALIIYKEKLEADPINVPALSGAVDCLQSLGNLDEAIALCNNAISIAPNLVITHVLLAYLYYDKEAVDKSNHEAKIVLEIDPNSYDVLCCYGALLFHQGIYQESSQYLKMATEIEPEQYMAHDYLSACYQRLGNSNGLYNEIKILARLRPTFENVVRLISSYFDKIRILVVPLFLLPILVVANSELKFLVLIYLPVTILYAMGGVVSLKNKQWQDSKKRFLIALCFIGFILFVLFSY